VAVQYYDDPKWLLMGVLDIVKKKKLHVYSTKDGLVCTGRVPAPPEDFINDTMKKLGPTLAEKNKVFSCPHLDSKVLQDDVQKGIPYLEIEWHSANVKIGICERCANKHKEHTMGA